VFIDMAPRVAALLVSCSLVALITGHATKTARADRLTDDATDWLCCYDPTEESSVDCMCQPLSFGSCPPQWYSAPLSENFTIVDPGELWCVAYVQYLSEYPITLPARQATWALLVNKTLSIGKPAFAARPQPEPAPEPESEPEQPTDTDSGAVMSAVPAVSVGDVDRIGPELRAMGVTDSFFQIVQQTCQHSEFAQCTCCSPATTTPCNPSGWDCCASVVFAPSTGGSCSFAPSGPCQCSYSDEVES